MSLCCLAPCCLLSVCGCGGGGGGVLRGGLGRGCIFFGELRVSAVWILQAVAEGINRLPLSFSSPPFSSGMGLLTEAVL